MDVSGLSVWDPFGKRVSIWLNWRGPGRPMSLSATFWVDFCCHIEQQQRDLSFEGLYRWSLSRDHEAVLSWAWLDQPYCHADDPSHRGSRIPKPTIRIFFQHWLILSNRKNSTMPDEVVKFLIRSPKMKVVLAATPLFAEIPKETIASSKRLHNYGKSPCLMAKSTINGHLQ